MIQIASAAHIHGEVYHFKAAGSSNWPKMSQAIAKIDEARAKGLDISANMYTYTAGATGLDAAMPPWVQEGGLDEWIKRLKDPAIRTRVSRRKCANRPTPGRTCYVAAGKPDNVLLVAFNTER